ncbi:MAG: glycerol kinase GlpK [Bacteroidota bacterium]
MEKKYILSLDQGTSSSKAVLFDQKYSVIEIYQIPISQSYPKPDYIEQCPEQIWLSQLKAIKNLLNKTSISADDIITIGITNQRETVVLWDKETGIPVYNAIVWQDTRTSDYCQQLINEGFLKLITDSSGLTINPYFSATKIQWILNNIEKAKNIYKKGKLMCGTIDSWLVWKLSGGKLHITDVSNASRTMLFNINTLTWDKELLKIFGIDEYILPKVCSSSEIYGYTDKKILGCEIPISGIAGDQQAALFGHGCFEIASAKNTYGTGCFMLLNTGDKRVVSKNGLISTVAWKIGNKTTYALEGSVFIAGAAIKWLRDGLKIIKSTEETEKIALSVDNSNEVCVIPAFTGLGAPYWNNKVKGAIFGLTQSTNYRHVVRATLESIAFSTRDIIEAMEKDSGIRLSYLNVDGGASANNFLMQFQSDVLQIKVVRPENIEATALGAAMLAGLSTGFLKIKTTKPFQSQFKVFKPNLSINTEILYQNWIQVLNKLI